MASKNTANTQKQSALKTLSLEEVGLIGKDEVQLSTESFSQYIRALHQNWRQGTVSCKTRGEVAFSNRKPWKQKGTGRARAGSLRSPVWRKGGVIFGPEPRVRKLDVPKLFKKNVLGGLINDYVKQNRVIGLEWQAPEKPKTKLAYQVINDLGLTNKKLLLFVDFNDFVTHASFNNIANVKMMLFDQANAYDLAHADYWIVLNKDKQVFNEMVSTWI